MQVIVFGSVLGGGHVLSRGGCVEVVVAGADAL